MNIIPLIIDYLATNRRLVIPQLGAFLRKANEETILFSEMLKRDDGILLQLICNQGIGELEAAGIINRFVFEVRHTIESGSVFQADGLGVFALGNNGAICFRHLPKESVKPSTDLSDQPAEKQTAQTVPAEHSSQQEEEFPLSKQEPKGTNEEQSPTTKSEMQESLDEAGETRRRIKELMRFESEHPRENRSSSHPHRDPSLRGLSYGKPQKTTDAYTYVGSAPSRRPDKFILLAITAVIIALGAILYGYLKDRKQEQIEQAYLEQISTSYEQPTLTE